jgi:hypothetical protein
MLQAARALSPLGPSVRPPRFPTTTWAHGKDLTYQQPQITSFALSHA